MAPVKSDFLFVCLESPPFVEIIGNRIRGTTGRHYEDLWTSGQSDFNMSFLKPTDEHIFGREVGNKTFTGAIGMLQRHEADAYVYMLGLYFPPEIVEHLPEAETMTMKMLQAPTVGLRSVSLLQTFNVFSLLTWSLWVLSIIAFGIAFTLTSDNKNVFSHSFLALRCYLGQTEIVRKLWKPLSCIISLLAACYLFQELVENLVHTDIISIDYSNVLHTLEDLDRLKQLTPCFAKGTPTTLDDNEKRKVYENIWKRVIKSGEDSTLFTSAPDMIIKWKPSYVWLSSDRLIEKLPKVLCGVDPKLKLWIPEEIFEQKRLMFYTRKQLELEKRNFFETRSRHLSEYGINFGLNWKIGVGHSGAPVSHSCLKEKMSDLFDQPEKDNPLSFETFVDIVLGLLFVIPVGGTLLVTEHLFAKIHTLFDNRVMSFPLTGHSLY